MLIKPRQRISLSASGKILLFLAVFLLFAAQNTGNNLLYLVSSCFFAGLLLSLFFSWRNLSELTVELLPPDFCFAGQRSFLRCRVIDRSGRARYSLAFGDDYSATLPAGAMVVLKAAFTTAQRGRYHTSQLKLFSCYPVDLFFTRVEIPDAWVAVGPTPDFSRARADSADTEGAVQKQVSGKEGDYWMQSHYREGDDSSLINWKISARSTQEWVLVKSINAGSSRRLYFDLAPLSSEQLELCLRRIMGLLLHLRNLHTEVYVWAAGPEKSYSWLSVKSDMAQIVFWLACYEGGSFITPPGDDVENVDLQKLMV